MKTRLLSLLPLLAAVLSSCNADAQRISYPAGVRKVFEKADAATSTSIAPRPVIGIPEGGLEYSLQDMVSAGALPVTVSTSVNDINAVRSVVAALDGFILTPSFAERLEAEVGKDDAPGLLLLKSLVDFNVPLMGTTPILDAINRSAMRRPVRTDSLDALVDRAVTYHKAKEILSQAVSIDSHSDQPDARQRGGYSVGRRSNAQTSIQKMQESGLCAQVLACYLHSGPLDDKSLDRAAERCFATLDSIEKDVASYPDACGMARTAEEVRALKAEGRKAFILAVENGYGVGRDLGNIRRLADRGVAYITLCHTRDNHICNTSSKYSGNRNGGLTDFGIDVVREMNRCGIIIDASHTGAGTFRDICEYSRAPFICSHSGADAIWHNNRNLTDRQLKELAKAGGVVQVYMVWNFMGNDMERVGLDRMMDHIDHCVKMAGIDHVGLGLDFDGGGGGWNLMGQNDLVNIVVKLLERGYDSEDIGKILGGNFLRVMEQVQRQAAL